MENLEDTDSLQFSREVPVEVGALVRLEFEGVQGRSKGTLLGVDGGEYLIVKLLDESGTHASKLFKGNSVIVRYLHSGTVYGFQAQTLGAIANPGRLLFISYPRIIARHELRREQRLPCMLPATLKHADTEQSAVAMDISRNGCRLSLQPAGESPESSSIEVDTEVSVAISLPGIEEPVTMEGKIRHATDTRRNLQVGIAFQEPSEDTKEKVYEKYIKPVQALLP